MALPVAIAKAATICLDMAKDKKGRKWLAIILALLLIPFIIIASLPMMMISLVFSAINPTGDTLQSDPYYLAMQEVKTELDIENELPVIVAKSVALIYTGDFAQDTASAIPFLQEHLVGSYERTVTETAPDPYNPDLLITTEHTETVYYFYSATEMLRIVQEPPYSFSEGDIAAIQEMYLLAEGNGGLDAFTGTLSMPVMGYVTSGYGNRFDPINGEYFMHPAIDILPEWHAPIIAIADGEVFATKTDDIYGNSVTIRHEVGGTAIYSFSAHLSRVDVKRGDLVVQGQTIGLEGGDQAHDPNPGRTTGHHLHFEIWEKPSRSGHVNPQKYLKG
ncbi:MAG: M23 family metallopeptidase [Angelakisella sp.]